MKPSDFPTPVNYAYGVFHNGIFLGIHTFALPLVRKDRVCIGNVVCWVDEIDPEGFIHVSKI